MLCSEIMKAQPECLGPAVPVSEAARRMMNTNVGFLPVCDTSGAVIGTITDRDIAVRIVAEQLPATTPVVSVMTQEVVACNTKDDLGRARQLMEKHRKSRIMCLDDDGHLAGVISLSDLAKSQDASGTLRAVARREAHA
jgi:CBS domain-containing protein